MPETARYADLMFSLSEKVDGAVSVKYQLPGEELDPDCLISVNDDSDVKARSLALPSLASPAGAAACVPDGAVAAPPALRAIGRRTPHVGAWFGLVPRAAMWPQLTSRLCARSPPAGAVP